MSNNDQITQMLTIVLMVMVFVFIALAVTFVFFWLKSKKKTKEIEGGKTKNPVSDAKKIAKEYTSESIFKFMEFEGIEDNMIIQKKGMRYIMVVECQGINYDLMSENEKIGVEEGFLQFLNTLRHPVQIYVQTRTVNLNDSIENYQRKVEEIGYELEKKKNAYLKKLQSGTVPKEELNKDFFEITKQTNLYEYGKDIILNTQRMSLNKNVLSKKYYVIVPYYVEDLGANSTFDKEEIRNMAFQELYTRSQSIIRTLSSCEVIGKILNSNELADLLYIAYNRDEAEVFSIDRAARAGYEELYTTAPDVLEKEMKALDEEIEKRAIAMANEKVMQARSPKQQQIDQKRARLQELVRQRAQMIIKQNAAYLGRQTAETAEKLIEENDNENKQEEIVEEEKPKRTRRRKAEILEQENNNEEGGTKDVEEKPKRTRRKKAVNE